LAAAGEQFVDQTGPAAAGQRRALVKYVTAQNDISDRRRWSAVGLLLGGLVGGFIDTWSYHRSIRDEDVRRWQNDRRVAYAAYLALTNVMLRDIDGVASSLPYSDDSEPISASDEASVVDGLLDYFMRWDDELQPALGEVQLLASPEVADMADRVQESKRPGRLVRIEYVGDVICGSCYL
jgi:hypothetical protein